MKNLQTIFGVIVSIFFTADKKGVTLSEISRIQAENKQKNDKFNGLISDGTASVFQKVIAFVGAGSNGKPSVLAGTSLKPEDIREYKGVAERNAQTATLMHALKVHKRLQSELKVIDLVPFVQGELPEAPVRPNQPTRGTSCDTDDFMELSNIDEMIASLKPEVLAQFDFGFFKKANELNARAAALGKLLSEQGSFFRELVRPLPKGSEQTNQSGVVITTWKKTYSAGEQEKFSDLREELQKEYNDLQQQLNGYRKQIKDAVREFDLEQNRLYTEALGAYRVASEQYNTVVEQLQSRAETLRREAQRELASLRVRV